MCEKFEYFLLARPFLLLTDHKALLALDRNILANQKIARWQERLTRFNFLVEYIPGDKNIWADLFSRPFTKLQEKSTTTEPTVLGKHYSVPDSQLKVYIPSWIGAGKFPKKLVLTESDELHDGHCLLSTVTNVTEKQPCDEFDQIRLRQEEDKTLLSIIQYLTHNVDASKWHFDLSDSRQRIFNQFRSHFFMNETNRLLMINWNGTECIVLPHTLVKKYLTICHDKNGHGGLKNTLYHLRHLWWQGKPDDVTNWVQTCEPCLRKKGDYAQKAKQTVGHIAKTSRPFESLNIDFVHLPKSSRGKSYALTIMCNFSRFLTAIPTVRDRAQDATEALTQFFLQYGTPKTIGSDRGLHFMNAVFANLCDALKINHQIHCAWRPQSSGNVERCHRTIKNTMWIMVNDLKIDWEQALPYAVRAFNCAPNAATGVSPYFAVYGRHPNVSGVELDQNEEMSPLEFGSKVRERLRTAYEAMKCAQKCSDEFLEKRLNPRFGIPQLHPGDKVLIKRTQSTEAKRTNMNWTGPFTVINCNGFIVHIQVQNGGKDFVHREHCVLIRERKNHLDDDIPFWEMEDTEQSDATNATTTDAVSTPSSLPASPTSQTSAAEKTTVVPSTTAAPTATVDPPDPNPTPHVSAPARNATPEPSVPTDVTDLPSPEKTSLPDSDNSDEFHSPTEFESPPENVEEPALQQAAQAGPRPRSRRQAPTPTRRSTRNRQNTDRWQYSEFGGQKTRRK